MRDSDSRARQAVPQLGRDRRSVRRATPGTAPPQTIQSTAVHLVRLCMIIERAWPLERANAVMLQFSKRGKSQMRWLSPPREMGNASVVVGYVSLERVVGSPFTNPRLDRSVSLAHNYPNETAHVKEHVHNDSR